MTDKTMTYADRREEARCLDLDLALELIRKAVPDLDKAFVIVKVLHKRMDGNAPNVREALDLLETVLSDLENVIPEHLVKAKNQGELYDKNEEDV